MDLFLWILGAVLVAVGLAGTVLPALPGAPLVWAGLACVAWADSFTRVSGWTLALLAVLAALTLAVDYLAAMLGAKRVGASRWAVVGALVGCLAGLVFSLPGLVLGAFAVLVLLLHVSGQPTPGKSLGVLLLCALPLAVGLVSAVPRAAAVAPAVAAMLALLAWQLDPLTIGRELTGTERAFVEQLFAVPGVGRLALQAALAQDIPVVQG